MKIFLIDCRTGCSCCSDENHWRGPYRTKEDAERRVKSFLAIDSKFWPLASQYADHGRYSIREFEAEELPDGRIIMVDRVFSVPQFIEVAEEGTISVAHENEIFAHELFVR